MNQIINMIIRQVMNQLVRRGVSAGFDQASKVGKRRKRPEYDEDGDSIAQQPTPEERAERRARRQARKTSGPNMRQAKQSMKTLRRFSKF